MELFDRRELSSWLETRGHARWASGLSELLALRYAPNAHGDLPRWTSAIQQLPDPKAGDTPRIDEGRVVVQERPSIGDAIDRRVVADNLMQLHPWRKGPFRIFGIDIDTEWRSDWKWDRIADVVPWRGASVLDVGCGNGYFGWRMLEAGAALVMGCDPMLLYNAQFEVVRRYWQGPERNFVVPLRDTDLPRNLRLFDVVVSMGLLYHRASPIEHLMQLREAVRAGGTVVLETLVLDTDRADVLVPRDRYAKMRNVWFIPSPSMMEIWLHRCGFKKIRRVDVVRTTCEEQRRTEWMQFESLGDFLDSGDPHRTVEGLPAPMRGIWVAEP